MNNQEEETYEEKRARKGLFRNHLKALKEKDEKKKQELYRKVFFYEEKWKDLRAKREQEFEE